MADDHNPMNPYGGRKDDDERGDANGGDGLEEMLRGLMGGGTPDPQMMDALRQMGMGSMDPAQMGMMQAQLQAMMSGDSGSAFNEQLAANVARQVVSAEGDPSVPTSTKSDVAQVAAVANLWLDAVTDFAAPGAPARALSRSEWVEATMPTWRKVVEPVAGGVGNAVADAMMKQLGSFDASDLSQLGIPEGMLPPGFDISSLSAQMTPMLKQMSAQMFGVQVGQAIGALAKESVTGTEVGLPLLRPNAVTILPHNVASFADGLELDAGEVHLYLAVREAARVRLYERVPWLDAALIAAVQTYAGDIRIDTDAIEEKLRDIDPQDAEALQGALAGNLFSPEPSDAQKRTLAHLENLLTLVEGWVDVVTDAAIAQHLPNAAALAEVVRRRRASAGPAEKVFSSLVGLELRPRRLREAAALWTQLTDATDAATRDGVWSHPDHVPSATDLDDPSTFIARASGEETPETGRDEMDDALDALLAQGLAEMGESSSAGGEGSGGSSTGRSSSDDASAGAASGEQAAMNPRDPRHDGLADRADEAPGDVDSAGSAKGGTWEDEGGAGDGDGQDDPTQGGTPGA